MSQILIQILITISIIAIGVLIAVLWRAFQILTDMRDVSCILKKRVNEFDTTISHAKESIINTVESVSGFIQALGIAKFFKQLTNENKK